jgi:hypothetical protein
MDPADAVDHAALDPMDIILLCPLEALLEVPVAAVECIRMETDLDHSLTPFEEVAPMKRARPNFERALLTNGLERQLTG